MKPVRFRGNSRQALKAFPDDAREEAGQQLYYVQNGQAPDDWKPMPTIGRGVREIRLREESGAYRVIYVATLGEFIFVLHAFQKKTQKTSKLDIELASASIRHRRNASHEVTRIW